MSGYIKGKCKKGDLITAEDIQREAYGVGADHEGAYGSDILAGAWREELNEILQVTKDSGEVADALNTYCGELKKLSEDSSGVVDSYIDTVGTISLCAQEFYDDAIVLQKRYAEFWDAYESGTNIKNMSARSQDDWKKMTTSDDHRDPTIAVFDAWANPLENSQRSPHVEGWYFKPYEGEAHERVKLKTQINTMMLIMESNIWSTTHEETGITYKMNRAFAGGAGGAMDSGMVEQGVSRAAEMNLRYLMQVAASVDPDDVAVSTDKPPLIDFSGYDGARPEEEQAATYSSKYNSAYLPVQKATITNITSYLVAKEDSEQNWLATGTAGYPKVTVTSQEASVQKISFGKTADGGYVRDFTQNSQADATAPKLAFYNFDGEVDSEQVSITTSFYSSFIELINTLKDNLRADSAGSHTELLRYLDGMRDYVSDVSRLTDRLGTSIACIITAWVEFSEERKDFDDEVEEAKREFRKELREEWGAFDPNDIIGDPSEFLANQIEKQLAASLEDLEADVYAREPEKLFYKEQCFLLTYIGIISEKKKDMDRIARRLYNYKAETFGHKRLPYDTTFAPPGETANENACLLMDGDPYAFLNKIAVSKNLSPLLNINSEMLSILQPYIRLFKVEFDKETGEETDIEISFEPAFTTFEQDLFTGGKVRNSGTGLKSFQFTYDGSNPFGAKKSIKATLNLFSNSFDELMIERKSPSSGIKYRYVDLAIKTFNKNTEKSGEISYQNEELAKLNFRLKAQVGYSIPKSTASYTTRTDMYDLQSALRDSVVTLNLIPTVHDFAFDEAGRVNFTINYLAYVEDTFSQAKFNVFSEPTYAISRIIRDIKMQHYSSKCESESVNDIKKSYALTASKELTNSMSHLFTTMMEKNKVFYMPISTEQIKKFVGLGPFATDQVFSRPPEILRDRDYTKSLQKSIKAGLKAYTDRFEDDDNEFEPEKENVISASLAAMPPDKNILSFFYVSDLLDIILENIGEELRQIPDALSSQMTALTAHSGVKEEQIEEKIKEYKNYLRAFEKTRFLLGPVEFSDHANTSNSMFVNLGDIPISVKYFFEWITSTMLDRDNNYYALTTFLNEFFNDLVSKFLNNDRCFDYSVKQRTRLNQATLLGSMGADNDRITETYVRNQQTRMNIDDSEIQAQLPLIRTFGNVSNSAVNTIHSAAENNFMIYFVGRTLPTEKMRGNRTEDEKLGIFHYQVGRDRGLVKDIKLSKTQTPGLQEVRFEQEGYDGLEQLRVVYDAAISTYANVNTFPGTYCYIDPAGYAPTTHPHKLDLTKYGVGGYYMIIRSEHTFGPGRADSEIEAKWVNKLYDPNDRVKDIIVRDSAGTEDKKNSKCHEGQRAATAASEAKPESITNEGESG
jgi:hypothetical protein